MNDNASIQVYKLTLGSDQGPPTHHVSIQGGLLGVDLWIACKSEDMANLLLTSLVASSDEVEALDSSCLKYSEDPRTLDKGEQIAEAVLPGERLRRLHRDCARRADVWTIAKQGAV
jgi:hypothetical protein